MTGNDYRQAPCDKPRTALIRIITLEAGHGAGRTERMMNRKCRTNTDATAPRRRCGWLWVYGTFMVFFALEIARLS